MGDIWTLCNVVRETAYAVHGYLRYGFPEKVYENALANRLRKQHMQVAQQHPIAVYDEDGTPIGEYFADLVVSGVLIVELKAAHALTSEHEAQLLGYLRATRLEHGMLLNFCARKFQIRKFVYTSAGVKQQVVEFP